jgi:putative colanic acid biosynthesis acetyltransferase WcaF
VTKADNGEDSTMTVNHNGPVLDASEVDAFSGGASFTLLNRLERITWNLCWTLLARWTPAPLHAWRRMLLKAFGAKLGDGVHVYGSARIWLPRNLEMGEKSTLGPRAICYNQGHVKIGAYTVISQYAHLCASSHNIDDPDFQLILRPIIIHDRAWIAADAFVGPGVTVGKRAVLGARGVAMKPLEPGTVYSGNPAVAIRRIARYDEEFN